MRKVLIALVRLYRATFGQLFGGNCRFHPSCSEYAIEAISANGAVRGSAQALRRVVRCGPWSKGGVDYPAGSVARVARDAGRGVWGASSLGPPTERHHG